MFQELPKLVGDRLAWTLTGLSVTCVLLAAAFSAWNWRCPRGGHFLGQRLSPKTCPGCEAPRAP